MRDLEKFNKWQREKNARTRAEYFKDKFCIKCGSIEKLELDHIIPADKVDHKIWSWTKSKRELEQAKCQILCRVCHQAKTRKDMGWDKKGTITNHNSTGYRNGCRCKVCTQAQVLRVYEYRLKTGRH